MVSEPTAHAVRTKIPSAMTWAVVVFPIGVVLTITMIRIGLISVEQHDFGRSLYRSGLAWLTTGRPYDFDGIVNLNPPLVTGLVFVPLAHLPLHVASLLWAAVGAACLLFAWTRTAQQLRLTPPQIVTGLGLLLCTMGAAGGVWLEGQLTWLLMVPLTEAWIASRRNRPFRAAAWLGTVVALKPVLALTALPLGLTICLGAACVAASLTLLSIAIGGWGVWFAWLNGAHATMWLGTPANASLVGLAARWSAPSLNTPTTINQLGPAAWLGLAVVGMCTFSYAASRKDADQRWVLSLTAAMLCAPIAWWHYFPLLGPMLLALWARGHWTIPLTCGVAMFYLPPVGYSKLAENNWEAGIVLGSIYCAGAILIYLGAAIRVPRTRKPLRTSS